MCDVSFLTKTFAPCESETAAVPLGAVIRRDVDVYKPVRVILRLHAVYQLSDDLLLVPRGYKDGEAAVCPVRVSSFFSSRK